MSKMRNLLKIAFLLLILCALAHTAFAEEVKTTNINKPSTQQALQKPLTDVDKHSNQQFLLTPLTPEDIIKEAQRSVDESISILKIVAIFIEVLVGFIVIIITIVGAFGFFEIRRWRIVREEIEKDAKVVKEFRNKAEEDINKLRNEMEKIPRSLTEEPSKEIKEKFDEFSRKLEFLELWGVSLKPEDYLKRGGDFYYKGKYNEALKAYDKAIELKPDYVEAWYNKGVVLDNLGRHDEALKAYDKAIVLKPDFARAWYNRACVYSVKGEKEKALSDLKKAIELDVSCKEKAKTDEGFKNLWDDEDFKKLVE